MTKQLTVGIVAGEISGDALGGDFMQKMNAIHPNIRWVGVGGAQMAAQGLTSLIDMSRLSVMGLVEVVKHLPNLLRAKKEILAAFEQEKIDIFVGIDAPDFNLRIGKSLKDKPIFRVQYVSPSVWAWRENRIHSIKKSCDLVLCLFPFELGVYEKHQHPAMCVGHPLLEKLQADNRDKSLILKEFIKDYQDKFNHLNRLDDRKRTLCVMAGSRRSEIQANLPLLIDAMQALTRSGDAYQFILPVVSVDHAWLVGQICQTRAPNLVPQLHIVHAEAANDKENKDKKDKIALSLRCMNIADCILLASGTATLEALLLHRPMVVMYRVNALTFALAKRLVKIPYVALPNILSLDQIGAPIVPELLQDDATGETIAAAALQILQNPQAQTDKLIATTHTLRQDSHHHSAQTVLEQFALWQAGKTREVV